MREKQLLTRLQLEKMHWKRKGRRMEKVDLLKTSFFFCLKMDDYYP